MPYRPCPDLPPPSDADVDTAETVEAASAIERGERHLRMLAELAEIAMTLARSLGELALTRIDEVKSTDAKLAPGEDPTAAFSKISQTIRRTIDLESRLAEQVVSRRSGLSAARAARRVTLDKAHMGAMDEATTLAVIDAYCDVYPEAEAEDVEAMVTAAENFRSEFDEFREYHKRPVGETVARLCEILNFDPTSCIKDGETWMVRSPPPACGPRRDPKTGRPDLAVFDSMSAANPPDIGRPMSSNGQAATGPPP